jgi:hypothetical protein
MTKCVWFSDIRTDHAPEVLGGLRCKYVGEAWEEPGPQGRWQAPGRKEAYRKYLVGEPMPREAFPEALYVWNEKVFNKIDDIAIVSNLFLFRGRTAEILSEFNLGEDGLIPVPVFREDKITPVETSFYFLRLGIRKDTILPDDCNGMLRKYEFDDDINKQIWNISASSRDNDIALSNNALLSSDIWIELTVNRSLFFSDRLVQTLSVEKKANPFKFVRCRVIEE